MHILVTGGAGFIGSHIVDALVERGDRVTVVDNLSTGSLNNLNPQVQFFPLDIRDERMQEVFQQSHVDGVIHQAAQISVSRSMEFPLEDAQINVEGTIRLLELSRQHGVGRFLFASSAAVYGEPEGLPIGETVSLQPFSPYGISKMAGEHYVTAYGRNYGLKTTVLRYGNVYGPRQIAKGEGGVVAIFCEKISHHENPCIQGDGKQTRDFIYVKDVAQANLAALDSSASGVFNVGTQQETSVEFLLLAMEEALNKKITPEYGPAREGDIRFSFLNCEKAQQQLGWSPRYSLTEGLKETWGHYQELAGRRPLDAD